MAIQQQIDSIDTFTGWTQVNTDGTQDIYDTGDGFSAVRYYGKTGTANNALGMANDTNFTTAVGWALGWVFKVQWNDTISNPNTTVIEGIVGHRGGSGINVSGSALAGFQVIYNSAGVGVEPDLVQLRAYDSGSGLYPTTITYNHYYQVVMVVQSGGGLEYFFRDAETDDPWTSMGLKQANLSWDGKTTVHAITNFGKTRDPAAESWLQCSHTIIAEDVSEVPLLNLAPVVGDSAGNMLALGDLE